MREPSAHVSPELARLLVPGTDPDVAAAYAVLSSRAEEESFGLEEELAFVDIETTGFDFRHDRVIEVAAVVAHGPEILGRWASLVRPDRRLPPEVAELTGIDEEELAEAPPLDDIAEELGAFLGDRTLVAHNAPFDARFLASACDGLLHRRWVDSLPVSRVAFPRLRSHRLVDLARAFELPKPGHRAAEDAEALALLWRVMLCGLSSLPRGLLEAVASLSKDPGWGLGAVCRQVAGALPEEGRFEVRALRGQRMRDGRGGELADAETCDLCFPDEAEVLEEFAPEGLVGAMYPGFEARDEQLKMSEAVLRALKEGAHLAVEAGTGVGKSVAYLVPMVRFAVDNGVAIGVATKTNALLDQLVHTELPALAAVLSKRGQRLRYEALKGYENYPCLRKVEREMGAVAADTDRADALGALAAWIAQTSWGDLDGLNLHWPPHFRASLSASSPQCEGKRCPYRSSGCFVHGARRRAARAHVVVTNHALLFRDVVSPAGVLPPLRHWVVDEAHGAEAEARRQLSLDVSHAELVSVLGALGGIGRGGAVDAVFAAMGGSRATPESREAAAALSQAAAVARTVTGSFFELLKDLAPMEGAYDRVELRITHRLRDTLSWSTLAGVGRSLSKRLSQAVDSGRALVLGAEESSEGREDAVAELVALLSRLSEQRDALVCVLDGTDDQYVYSLMTDRRREVPSDRLSASRLDVGSVLAEQFYPNVRTVVFASATIATGGPQEEAFEHFAQAVGLDRLDADGWRGLRLASSYDFERQMAAFVPIGLPEPARAGTAGYPAYLDELSRFLAALHLAMGGATLTLFTNRRDMEALYERVEPALRRAGLRLLLQGRDTSRKRLREEFVGDEAVSLFATRSFWEGFDAKGDTLRCVVVPRLPFGQMGDPLLEERRERYPDWWERWYLPQAILELKQAAGRLIRSSTDVGCLVLADARLAGTKGYARSFLQALPVRDVEMLPADEVIGEVERRFGREAAGGEDGGGSPLSASRLP